MSLLRDKSIMICIPAYNEVKNIGGIINNCKTYSDVVVVYDDGSTDGTAAAATEAGATVLSGRKNRGYGFAVRSLFQFAKENNTDIMVTLDSDGQHDPRQIPNLINPILEDEVDLVIGSRFLTSADRDKVPKYRTIGIKTITKLAQVASYSNITDAQSGFRAYGKNALSRIALFEEGMAVSTEILLRSKETNLMVKEVPITITYAANNRSTHHPITHGVGVLYSILQFISLKHPLACYGIPGIALLLAAGFYMNGAMELYASTKYISTNMILVSIGTSVFGLVLLVTGTILYSITALLRGKIKES